MRAAADAQVKVWCGYFEILQDRVRHVVVVVLARVNEHRIRPVGCLERMVKRRDFHEVRTRRGNQVNRGQCAKVRRQKGVIKA